MRWLLETPPLYTVTLAIVAGDALGNSGIFFPLWIAIALAVSATVLFMASRPALAMAIALAGISAAATVPVHQLLYPRNDPAAITRFADNAMVTLEGRLVREPEAVGMDRTYLYARVKRAGPTQGSLTSTMGLVRIAIVGAHHFRIGDEIRITSRLRFPRNDGNPGEFDYRSWLLRQGIGATMFVGPPKAKASTSIAIIGHENFFPATTIEAIRERIGEFIDANLTYPANVEMRALIIGDRGGIDENLRQTFALTGMAHLLVISGLHLGIVASAAFLAIKIGMGLFPVLMARGYANKFAAAGATIAALAYATIAGHHVSTTRALVMVLAYTVAIMIDRARELAASLAIAALLICFALPGSTADIGFQLSFASVIAILLGMRRHSSWWRRRDISAVGIRVERAPLRRITEWTTGYVAVSFWALLGTAPLTAFHFNQVSTVGLIANALVVPIMGFGAVITGLAAALASFIWKAPARELLRFAGLLAVTGTGLARWFAAWPFAWARIFTPTIVEIAIAYGFLALWLFAPLPEDRINVARRTDEPGKLSTRASRWRPAMAATLAAAFAIDASWWIYQRYLDSDLRVTFLSVGQGDGAVVRFPGSRVMLIDGGGGFPGSFDPGESIVASYLWANKIGHVDYLVLSHPDRDHFGGLIFIARNFSPNEFWTGGTISPDVSYSTLIDAVRSAGARSRLCQASSLSMIIGGVDVRCVGPVSTIREIKDNNSSAVLRLAFGPTSFLFPGDLEAKGERELIATRDRLDATILKVPHHGSRTSSSDAFLAAVDPAMAVISLGYLNRFHFPASVVLDRYAARRIELLRTDQMGAISVEASAKDLRAWTFRGGVVSIPRRPPGMR
jgi:competence protein ComEC